MKTKTGVRRAIMKLPKLGGHGALVAGGIILTAAHCIDFSTTGGTVLGDHYVEEIVTRMGKIEASPVIFEPYSSSPVEGKSNGRCPRPLKPFQRGWSNQLTMPRPAVESKNKFDL